MKETLIHLYKKETLVNLSARLLEKYPNKRVWILLNGKVIARFNDVSDLYINLTILLGEVNVKKVRLVDVDIAIDLDKDSFLNKFNLL